VASRAADAPGSLGGIGAVGRGMRERITMTPERWTFTCDYLVDVFGQEPAALGALRDEARAAGLPDIAVSADVGQLLRLLTTMTGVRTALELGTLAGYSASWIAAGLAPGGKLTTIELDAGHAAVARAHFARTGLADRVDVVEGAALEVLPGLVARLGPLDLVFADAVKSEYPDYWRLVRNAVRPGGLFIADNVLGSSRWWIDERGDPNREGADTLNRLVASDPEFDAIAVPLREGVLVARRRG
jgi:predicted O-methyltransferase YrrM